MPEKAKAAGNVADRTLTYLVMKSSARKGADFWQVSTEEKLVYRPNHR